ncbi:uncharacterized protein LOC111047121 isoform X2 [Nilaparvata lugens]|uniref:uncharacterized protein LOC111047121 isoform X2 n=1 Tax=Nilaparvata lugens TaxID=108931 RepID=UPI00193D2BE9|nr:uncharacterized protein LOC111047121 isoform X2 [Nilaparvata lugens]
MDSNPKQNKGKSASSSISSIAIRFHADDEEIEEVVQSEPATTADKQTQPEIVEEESSSVSSSQLSTPTSTGGDSQGYLTRLSKRSASLESASPSDNSSGDAWRLFKDFRGRITKTVEEKLEEIKSDRLKNKQRQHPKLGSRLENSSISDSEDQSEGSTSVKSETPSVDGEGKEKDAKESVEVKNVDRLSDNVSVSSDKKVASTGSSSEKDEDRATKKGGDDKEKAKDEKFDEICGLFKKKKEVKVAVETSGGKKKCDEEEEKKEEDETMTPTGLNLKKDKKRTTKFFSDRFSRTTEKKSAEVSMTFSSLKNEDSEEDEILSVEFGTEADEALGVVSTAKRPSLISVISSEMARPLGTAVTLSAMSRLKQLLWNWKVPIFVLALACAHKLIDTGYFFGFLVGVVTTVILYRTLDRIEILLGFKDSALNNTFDSKSLSGANLFPIFSHCDHLPGEDPEKCVHEGWINEFPQEYSPDTYHISLTETVHIRLEGSTLRISSPSTKIPKRAYWNEPEHKKLFNRQRLYDIAGCKVQLLPVGLIHKRIWSKKYPICITLLKMSKIGVRYRTKGKITIEDDAPWLDPELDDKTPTPSDEQLTPQFKTFNNRDEDDFEDVESADSKETPKSDAPQKDAKPPEDAEVLKIVENQSSTPDVEGDDDDFVRISPSLLHEFNLFFFARSDRQKEIWYRRLVAASSITHSPPALQPVSEQSATDPSIAETSLLVDNANLDSSLPVDQDKEKQKEKPDKEQVKGGAKDSPQLVRKNREKKYLEYMNSLAQVKVTKPPQSCWSKEVTKGKDEGPSACEKVMWVNAFSGRILYDVLSNDVWLAKIQEKFQKKLAAIKLPVFMEDLVISDLSFGETIPVVQNTSRPVIDEDGIWVDLDVTYEGSFRMTIDTKINLMKLKKDLYPSSSSGISTASSVPSLGSAGLGSETAATFDPVSSSPQLQQKSAMFDSDVEDSAESSSEEADSSIRPGSTIIDLAASTPASPSGGGSSKMLRMVDKIAASKYFQQVTDNKFIKRAMEGVSNTNIALVVEVKGLSGTLVLNFPPPPSDRLWYGFRGNPKVSISAQPKVGERMVTMLHITSWIEKRLVKEFQVSIKCTIRSILKFI